MKRPCVSDCAGLCVSTPVTVMPCTKTVGHALAVLQCAMARSARQTMLPASRKMSLDDCLAKKPAALDSLCLHDLNFAGT
jgi:hypothetical protein